MPVTSFHCPCERPLALGQTPSRLKFSTWFTEPDLQTFHFLSSLVFFQYLWFSINFIIRAEVLRGTSENPLGPDIAPHPPAFVMWQHPTFPCIIRPRHSRLWSNPVSARWFGRTFVVCVRWYVPSGTTTFKGAELRVVRSGSHGSVSGCARDSASLPDHVFSLWGTRHLPGKGLSFKAPPHSSMTFLQPKMETSKRVRVRIRPAILGGGVW